MPRGRKTKSIREKSSDTAAESHARNKQTADFSCEPAPIGADHTVPVIIENITPSIDSGLFPVKWIAGKSFTVEADIFRDGHDALGATVLYKTKNESSWRESRMAFLVNDRWRGSFVPEKNTRYLYTVEAWVDHAWSWIHFMEKKCPFYSNVEADLLDGLKHLALVEEAAHGADEKKINHFNKLLELSAGASDEVLQIIKNEDFRELITKYPVKSKLSRFAGEFELVVDRKRAEYGAWYEMFPRSQGKSAEKSGTFKDCIKRLPEIKKMGFDVIYLPPIHPIGSTNRKGRNNVLQAAPGDPGSPWAIGNEEGGHKAVHPELGTLKDFENFIQAAGDYGIEIALDFAIQCSPDHPYVKEHPEWFYHLPDGSIRYAENPPKKYQDIYPLDFYCENHEALWQELRSIVLFWIERGVKIFRVDNPHTKPLRFWRWLIESVQAEHPEVIFLAEAFTRPKVMKFLAKAGFTQSYTYFTWRNAKWELRQYLEELTQSDMKNYFRGNFFANTPDILHELLQKGGKPAFKLRLVLAAILSSNYGIYSGYELCENKPVREGSEEYLHSEKYEIKWRDWSQPDNIIDFIARLNRIRNENPALQEYLNLEFYDSMNDNILCFGKRTADNSNMIVVVVNLDPFHTHEDTVVLPIWKFGIEGWQTYQVKDLITGDKYYWKGSHNYIRLDPEVEPVHIFRLKK